MEQREILVEFAKRFVTEQFRERFVHEALKKPGTLHARICHDIEKVFDAKFRGNGFSFKDDDECLFLEWSKPLSKTTWRMAQSAMSGMGIGYLVIKTDATSFYAETEARTPIQYAGRS